MLLYQDFSYRQPELEIAGRHRYQCKMDIKNNNSSEYTLLLFLIMYISVSLHVRICT